MLVFISYSYKGKGSLNVANTQPCFEAPLMAYSQIIWGICLKFFGSFFTFMSFHEIFISCNTVFASSTFALDESLSSDLSIELSPEKPQLPSLPLQEDQGSEDEEDNFPSYLTQRDKSKCIDYMCFYFLCLSCKTFRNE